MNYLDEYIDINKIAVKFNEYQIKSDIGRFLNSLFIEFSIKLEDKLLDYKSPTDQLIVLNAARKRITKCTNDIKDLSFNRSLSVGKIIEDNIVTIVMSNLQDLIVLDDHWLVVCQDKISNYKIRQYRQPMSFKVANKMHLRLSKNQILSKAFRNSKTYPIKLSTLMDSYYENLWDKIDQKEQQINMAFNDEARGKRGNKYTQAEIAVLFSLLNKLDLLAELDYEEMGPLIGKLTNTGSTYMTQNISQSENIAGLTDKHVAKIRNLLELMLNKLDEY